MTASSTNDGRTHRTSPPSGKDGLLARLLNRLVAYLVMALLAIVLAIVLGILIASFFPSLDYGQAHGQEKPDVQTVLQDGAVPVQAGGITAVSNENVAPDLMWKFVTTLPEVGKQFPGTKMKLVLEAAETSPKTFEVTHGGALGIYPYGKREKAAHLIDYFRKTPVALDQIELDFYDFDELTKSGYKTLLEQMQSANTDAFALKDTSPGRSNPFMILVADWPTATKWDGIKIAYEDTPFVGTAVVWNQDVAKLLDYYSAVWSAEPTVPASTEQRRMQYAKAAMSAVLASANGVETEQLAQFADVDGTPDGKIYIGLPSQLKELGPDHVEAFSFKSHLQSGLYGVDK